MNENNLHQFEEVAGGQSAGSSLGVQYQNTPKQPGSESVQADTSQADTAGPRLFRSKVDVAMAAEFAVAERMDLGAQQKATAQIAGGSNPCSATSSRPSGML